MKKLAVAETFLSRILIIALNFALVIFTTNFWGVEGKGMISMLIADLAMISFGTMIFSGSSVMYLASRVPKHKLVITAYIWSVFAGILLPVSFGIAFHREFLPYLVALSVFTSLLSTNVNLFVGEKKIRLFNLYSVLQQLLQLGFMAVLVFGFRSVSVKTYFLAQIFSLMLLFATSSFQLFKNIEFKGNFGTQNLVREMFRYGFNTQFSAFLQFLSYRLSYYFLEYFKGIASVGIYSVGVAVSEAIWTLSRSISLVLYSEAVNSSDSDFLVTRTKVAMKSGFVITFLFLIFILIVPSQFYTFIFGKNFSEIKEIILLLSPGILAMVLNQIIGHYFAGINRLQILNIKSLVSVLITIGLNFLLIPKFGIVGACVATSVSYIVSTLVLLIAFYRITPFKISDFYFSKMELRGFLNHFKRN